MPADELAAFERFAGELADAAARVTLPAFRATMAVEDKGGRGGFDPVTPADREAERVMRALITQRYPAHGVRGEEAGVSQADAALQWVLDPIDGTRSYICGIPLWGTLIALCENGRPVLGCVDQPYLGERFVGSARGAQLHARSGTRALNVRACASLAQAMLFCTDPANFAPEDRARFERLHASARLTRYGADCYAYCMLAAGQVDLVVEGGLSFHDIAALVPIIEAAGGVLTDWEGHARFDGGRFIAAGDRWVHAQALAVLAS